MHLTLVLLQLSLILNNPIYFSKPFIHIQLCIRLVVTTSLVKEVFSWRQNVPAHLLSVGHAEWLLSDEHRVGSGTRGTLSNCLSHVAKVTSAVISHVDSRCSRQDVMTRVLPPRVFLLKPIPSV